MKKIIEHGKNLVKKVGEKGKKALLIVSTASMLAWWLSSCNNRKSDFYSNGGNKILTDFEAKVDKVDLNIPNVIHWDSNKIVILFSNRKLIQCEFIDKWKSKKDVYSFLESPQSMEVYSVEKWKCTRDHQKVSPEEARKILAEITSYME